MYDDDDNDGYLIENKGSHKYLRRIPWTGRKKKYRYVYDPRIAAKLPVQPSPGEKVKVPHGAQAGHYEVLRVQRLGNHVVADLRHDETGHRMLVRTDALHRIVQDVFASPMPLFQQAASAAAPAAGGKKRKRSKKSQIDKLIEQQRRDDALPKAKWRVFDAILEDNNIEDYDLSVRDQQYLAWQRGKAEKPGPLPRTIGLLDAFLASGERRQFCCLREAFNYAIRDAKTWKEIEPAMAMLRTVKDFEEVHLPSYVLERHAIEQQELRSLEEAESAAALPGAAAAEEPDLPDYTRYGVAYDPKLTDDDLTLLAATHDFASPGARRGAAQEQTREPGEDDYDYVYADDDELPPL